MKRWISCWNNWQYEINTKKISSKKAFFVTSKSLLKRIKKYVLEFWQILLFGMRMRKWEGENLCSIILFSPILTASNTSIRRNERIILNEDKTQTLHTQVIRRNTDKEYRDEDMFCETKTNTRRREKHWQSDGCGRMTILSNENK